MRIALTKTFRRGYGKLPLAVQEKVDRQIVALATDPHHPSLVVKKIKGAPGIWEARVDRGYRMTFVVREDVIILRRVGPHDATLRRP
ncbi:MAG: hypothetical protein M1539_06875 [Actinobacteria bacterium]|nr:hypothetical protein [Actinomycetota bacterium]